MEELDLLKKDWQKNEAFEQVSEGEIYGMLHKKSSTVVKWILIVSVLEFVILNGIALLLNDKSYDEFLNLYPFINFLEKFNYLVIIVFIYCFYRNYKSISVINSSKRLIEHILKTRKTVVYYIFWNIFIGGFSGALGGIEGFNEGYNAGQSQNTKEIIEANFITLLFTMLLIMGFIWLFYKLIYGRFLNNLKENLEELKKIDL